MTKLIKIEFYPEYMDKITSFHNVNESILKLLNDLINDNSFFIENFYRVSKNIYKHIDKNNLLIQEIDSKNLELVEMYLNEFGNNTDLLDLLDSKLNLSSNSDSNEYTFSDENLTESFNVNKLIKLKLNNDNTGINNLFIKNPELKNAHLDDIFSSSSSSKKD
tara:strand:- start:1711 stop:2199 length:489 start_codon:yes stop_codon:yes gene_type:complete